MWMDKADTRNPTRVQRWTLLAVQARTDSGGYWVERVLTRYRVNGPQRRDLQQKLFAQLV